MKKINSIGYGGKVILSGLLLLLSGAILRVIISSRNILFNILTCGLIGVGLILLIGFSIVLAIELHQDKKIDQQYQKVKYRKIKIGVDRYECQACGNTQVGSSDFSCKVCGVHFIE